MTRISTLAALVLTTIALALVGTTTALARQLPPAPLDPVTPTTSRTEQITTVAASPLWQFVVVAVIAAAVTALVLVATAALARRRHSASLAA